jgi:hypothetical protein
MEIDLDRARRAIIELGEAFAEARAALRLGNDSVVRIRTEAEVIEIPTSWAIAGLVALTAATVLSNLPTPSVRRRVRDEEPLGIG